MTLTPKLYSLSLSANASPSIGSAGGAPSRAACGSVVPGTEFHFCGVHLRFHHSNETAARSQTGSGRLFPHCDSSLLHQPRQKRPSVARKRQFTRPRRASCSFGTGDEGIKNLIPRRHNARVLWLDHPIKPLGARRIGIDDIQRAGADCVCLVRSPSHWRRQRGGILDYIRVAVNAVNCDDGI